MSDALELQRLLDAQPSPDCAALTPSKVEEADFAAGRVVMRFAPQPAFKNHFGNVQGGDCRGAPDVKSLYRGAEDHGKHPTHP
jgi:hypothetical protein